jgi:transaldolase
MKTAIRATEKLHEIGQSLWLDNITRGLLTSGTLRRYIQHFSITGLTSNPTIFDHAVKNSHDYDDAIRQKTKEGKSGEALFFEQYRQIPLTSADIRCYLLLHAYVKSTFHQYLPIYDIL